MRARGVRFVLLALFAGCGGAVAPGPSPDSPYAAVPLPPELPEVESGWGTPVLALAGSPERGLWAGTHGRGLWLLREPEGPWEQILSIAGPGEDAVVNAIATDADVIWYGTPGAGFGRSTDGGATWRRWTAADLGGGWAHVAAEGIVARDDEAWLATMSGLRITRDGGDTWTCIGAADEPPDPRGSCTETVQSLPSKYLLTLDRDAEDRIWVGHLGGIAVSDDGGRSWRELGPESGVPRARIRQVTVSIDSLVVSVWAATETAILRGSHDNGFEEVVVRVPGWPAGLPGSPRSIAPSPSRLADRPTLLLTRGMASREGADRYRMYYLAASDRYAPAGDMWSMAWWGPPTWPISGSSVGIVRVLAGRVPPRVQEMGAQPAVVARPESVERAWLERPIGDEANPYPDPLLPFGAAVGGNVREHIAFNNPAGTPVLAVGAGSVTEAGAGRVVLRLDRSVQSQPLVAVYTGVDTDIAPGTRVAAGDRIGTVARSSGETPDRVLFQLRLGSVGADGADGSTALNPHLWLRPMPGTGVVAGRVLDQGSAVPGTIVHGFVLPYPEETPYGGVPTYAASAASDPTLREHFALSGVPAGNYLVGVDIDGQPVFARAVVEPGGITMIELAR